MLFKEYKKHDYLINTHDSLVEAKNDAAHVDERRYANLLRLTALGTLVMGIWNIIKTFMDIINGLVNNPEIQDTPLYATIIGTGIIFVIVFIIVIMFRFIIWKGASREAEDGKKRYGYIVCAVILLVYGIYIFIRFFKQGVNGDADGYTISNFILDLTSFVFICELLHSVYKLRKIRKEIAEEN